MMPVPASSFVERRPASMLMVNTRTMRHTRINTARKRHMVFARTLFITKDLDFAFLEYTINIAALRVCFLTVCIITEHMFDVKRFRQIFSKNSPTPICT